MPASIRELAAVINNLYEDKVESIIGKRNRRTEIQERIWKHFEDQVPEKKFGEMYITNRKAITAAFQNTKDWWDEEYWKWEDLIENATERVIQGAKEDVAQMRTDDAQEEDEDADEVDPDDIGEDELDDEVLWQWWPQEYHHNVADRHWIGEIFKKVNLDQHDFRNYGLRDLAYREYVQQVENDGSEMIEDIEKLLEEVESHIEKPRIIKWVFYYEDFDEHGEWPIEW